MCVTCQKSPPNHGTAEFDKLLLETEPVAHNVVLTSKLCPQAFFMPYSTDNRNNQNYTRFLNVVGDHQFFSEHCLETWLITVVMGTSKCTTGGNPVMD